MRIFGLYLLRQTIVPLLATTAIALVALLLERMIRLMNLTANSDISVFQVVEMLANLIPHYLGIALPAAFFIGILLAFNRMSGDSELVAITASGASLRRLLSPIMGLALALTLLALAIFGYLQPYSRYGYRSLAHTIGRAALTSALEEGAFIEAEGLTFMAERVSAGGRHLTRVFVYAESDDGGSITTTAKSGALAPSTEDKRSVLYLVDGVQVNIAAGDQQGGRVLSFDKLSQPIGDSISVSFRPRGKDAAEMTLDELLAARDEGALSGDVIAAEFHGRLARALTVLFLPLLAIPLGLGGGRARRGYGIVVGLVILVIYQKLLEFGGASASLGSISPWFGLWLPLGLFGAGSVGLFLMTGPSGLTNPIEGLVERLAAAWPRRWGAPS
ncbi:MAG: LPS export ABC transporter permease LptF [Alphaproteobacteria bacterium]|jgi:lipopolysaccharide export system permease protein